MGGRFETGVIMGTAPCNYLSAAAPLPSRIKLFVATWFFCRSVSQAAKEGDLLPAAKPRTLMGHKFELGQAETFLNIDNQEICKLAKLKQATQE